MKNLFAVILLILIASAIAVGQIADNNLQKIYTNITTDIMKAEDARDFSDKVAEYLTSPLPIARKRAALAAGRIGDDKAIPALAKMLVQDTTENRAMAAFAIGEIESVKGADAILKVLANTRDDGNVRARAVEAAGKIAAANAKDAKATELGKAIVAALEFEAGRRSMPHRDTILMGLTAVLRARPEGGDAIAARFLGYSDWRIRADALNTLARLRAKNVNEKARELLAEDPDPVVRASAARVLGAAEDKEAIDLLVNAATKDVDSRVRVSSIRALGNLKDAMIVDRLFADKIIATRVAEAVISKVSCIAMIETRTWLRPVCKAKNLGELLEIANTISRLAPNTNHSQSLEFIKMLREIDDNSSPEVEIANAKIVSGGYLDKLTKTFFEKRTLMTTTNGRDKPPPPFKEDFYPYSSREASAYFAGLRELANSKEDKVKSGAFDALNKLADLIEKSIKTSKVKKAEMIKAYPDFLSAYAAFKSKDLAEKLRTALKHEDVFVRAAAAGLIADVPASPENVKALKESFSYAFVADKHDNDAVLSVMDALYKLDKKEAVGSLLTALGSPDYLVRKKAFELLKDEQLQKDFPGLPTSLENARSQHRDKVLPYSTAFGTKLGQILNKDADYLRALKRRNGQIKAVVNTVKGSFTIEFFPEDAPLTVDNFIELARSGYFNGLTVHRVVPNFVMQDGDPRGDGNGGPGWSIRCEVNMLQYERGMVGMALSGKDTGGSQWFVTHSPQPHLDGGYTIFGKVNEEGMKVVDSIARGDTILSIKVVGDGPVKRGRRISHRWTRINR